jgi:arylsulfatase
LRLFVNDKPTGEGEIKRVGFRSGGLEPFEVGRDSITAIAPDYKDQGDFAFTGTIEEVKFEIKK